MIEGGCSFVLHSKIHNTKTNPGASHYCTKALRVVLLGFSSLKKVEFSKGSQLFGNKHIILESLCLKWLLSIVATSRLQSSLLSWQAGRQAGKQGGREGGKKRGRQQLYMSTLIIEIGR